MSNCKFTPNVSIWNLVKLPKTVLAKQDPEKFYLSQTVESYGWENPIKRCSDVLLIRYSVSEQLVQ